MSRPLRVLLVLGSLQVGGTERQVIEILRSLDRRRFEPRLYLIYRRGELLGQVPDDVPVTAYWDRHRTPRVHLPGRILCSQIQDLRREIRRQQVDVVYDRASHATLLAGLATPASVPRVAVVVAEPELDFAQSHARFRRLKQAALRGAYRRATRVLAVSEGVRQGLLQFHQLDPQRVVTCSNLFDVARMDQQSGAPCVPFPADRFNIVCVGRLQREKGQRVLVSAVDILVHQRNRCQLLVWLIGDGPDEPSLRKGVAARGLEAHFRFEGYRENPLPYIRQAQLFCLPSLFEGMPNALVEAMICRTPVIAADCRSGPREILADGRWGKLVPPGDELQLADAVDEALADLEAWRLRAAGAREHVAAAYSLQAGIARLESILEQVAASRS